MVEACGENKANYDQVTADTLRLLRHLLSIIGGRPDEECSHAWLGEVSPEVFPKMEVPITDGRW